MSIDYEALTQVFLAESEEGIQAIETGLLRLESNPADAESLREVFRAAHTLKGGAATVGFGALGRVAHAMEDVLDALRAGQLSVGTDTITLLFRAVDVLRRLLTVASEGEDALSPQDEALAEALRTLSGQAGPPAQEGVLETPKPIPAEVAAAPSASRSTLRVGVERLDQLVRLAGEIAVARDRASQLLEDPDTPRRTLQEAHREAEQLHLDLQELVMSLRLVPVGPAFQQLARTVRDLARSLGKEARLVIEGGEVEVDNSVLQMLKDPLTHLVRNAVDHGIEPAETRSARGKSPCGSITLRSRHEAGGIVIEIEDDGAGLDPAAILARARSQGLVAGDAILDDAHVLSLVFEPGFSTAGEVSEISGRGVGLDVVRRNVQALRGTVAIEGRPGEGTRLRIRLPLTLAIIEGLVARVDEERYVIPIETVGESLALPASQAARENGRGVLSLRDRAVPWVRLRTLFGITTPRPRRELAVVIQTASGPAGLVVDQMEGQGQVVIKPLPKVFEGLRGITASAVLGTGRVALILDAAALLAGEAAPAAG